MWALVRRLRDAGTTIILTTHYIQEAEEMADRIGVINRGDLLLVEDKASLMRQLGKKELVLELSAPLSVLPPGLDASRLSLAPDGETLTYTYDRQAERTGIASLLADLAAAGIRLRDLKTRESSLEEIFVSLVREERP